MTPAALTFQRLIIRAIRMMLSAWESWLQSHERGGRLDDDIQAR